MKKTFSINVAGFPFTIDEDAYILLNDYLQAIEHAFSKEEDATEIINDIEGRVAELLAERTAEGSPIITVNDVEEVISRIGKPEEMVEADEEIVITENVRTGGPTPPPYIPPLPPVKKKLFRDPQNAMLGGVCSGLAWYMNIDPTVVRLATVLLTILSASTVGIAYIILWIVVPEARTPLERLQMMGEQPTMANIAKTVTGTFREETGNVTPSNHRNNFGDALASFFGICAKVLIIIGLIIGIPCLIGLVLGLLGCIFALITFLTGITFDSVMPEWYQEAGTIPIWGILCGIGCILTIGIPLFILIRMGLKKRMAPLSKGVRNTLVIVWILGFILAGFSTGKIVNIATELDKDEVRREMMNYSVDENGITILENKDSVAEDTDSVKGKREIISITSEGIVIDTDSVKMEIGTK
ncbi:MAG: PspC domain-containing protein [Muribaculaceae bacterium]|nr:PspC domain-containing protein [Muribaculaceae bacterium]